MEEIFFINQLNCQSINSIDSSTLVLHPTYLHELSSTDEGVPPEHCFHKA